MPLLDSELWRCYLMCVCALRAYKEGIYRQQPWLHVVGAARQFVNEIATSTLGIKGSQGRSKYMYAYSSVYYIIYSYKVLDQRIFCPYTKTIIHSLPVMIGTH